MVDVDGRAMIPGEMSKDGRERAINSSRLSKRGFERTFVHEQLGPPMNISRASRTWRTGVPDRFDAISVGP